MGSLTSRPKAPELPQTKIVYVASPAATPAPGLPATPSQAAEIPAPAPDPETETAKARVQSLLERNRSRLGTILTGFRGILSPSDAAPQRKTLLGE